MPPPPGTTAGRAPAVPPGAPMAARTRLLLEGPAATTLLRLATPTVLVMLVQATVSTLDAHFVGWVGPDALAGVSLVFPLVMLMQTMSAGGMGGGVASAVARALGAGRRDDANALAAHALLIGLGMAAIFTSGALTLGPGLYALMGGRGSVLDAAMTYGRVMFGGATAFWLANTLASVVRGTGVMVFPALAMVGSGILYLLLSPALVLGAGPFPQLGVAGAAAASVASSALGAVVLATYLRLGRTPVALRLRGFTWRPALFWEILRVGAPGSANTVLANLTVVLLTGFVGPFGPRALAGYGMGTRLEYLQIPLVFGFGSALVAMVGTNVGAGRRQRAEHIAWVGAGLAAALTGSIGLAGALFPERWMALFTNEASVQAVGTRYLQIVGPVYGFFGLGLALYFASQGAGRLAWPLVVGLGRLVIAATGGWVALRWLDGGLDALFVAIAVALVCFGSAMALVVKLGAWR